MSDSDPNLKINCWTLGDRCEHVFSVQISRNKNVDALKDAIKAKKHNLLKDIDASDLILYKVSILCSPELAEHATALKLNELMLNPVHRLSKVFADRLLRDHVHVAVELSSGAWVYVVLSLLR